MKKYLVLSCALLIVGHPAIAQEPSLGNPSQGQSARIVKFGELSKMMSHENDTTYLFNFFATWCEPCVKEFPSFQRFSAEYANQKIRLIFVSLDFRKDFKKHLLPFVKKHRVTNEVVLLDDPDYNSWIDKVDSAWDGNLPATLVINNTKHIHQLFAQEFTYASLDAAMRPFLP